MQAIHDDVAVFVTQRELQARAPKPDGSRAATTALQYVAENTGFSIVTFRVDFSESVDIKLHRPAERTQGSVDALEKATQPLTFECTLYPFERRVLAYVVKKRNRRAFVRVQYAVLEVATPSVDAVVEAQEKAAEVLSQQLQRSNQTFSHTSKWEALPCRAGAEVDRACAEINRYFRDVGEVFVDASFPPTAKSHYDPETSCQLPEHVVAVYGLCTWGHLHNVADSAWTFVAPPETYESGSRFSYTSGIPAQDSFLCAMSILAPHRELWLHRWFPSLDAASRTEDVVALPVSLCDRGLTWEHLLVDLFLPAFPLGSGLMAPRNARGELYASLLHKAYAKLKGSYAAVAGIPTLGILRELTGSPWVCVYCKSSDDYGTGEQAQLQQVVQLALSHRRRRRGSNSTAFEEPASLVIATFGAVDGHHRAFRLTTPSGEDSGTTCVVLHDASGGFLQRELASRLVDLDQDQDPAAVRVSWEQLSALQPAAWSLALGRHHEQRLRRIFHHRSGSVEMSVALSVPTLSTIVFSWSYAGHAGRRQVQADLDVSVASVETNFSLTRIDDVEGQSATPASLQLLYHEGVSTKQVVKTLSAGEYVVTVSAKRSDHADSAPVPSEPAKAKAALTPASIDGTLPLVFDCLDRQGRHELSESDIASFLQLNEHVTPTPHGKEALRSFLLRHGSCPCPGSEERSLTLDDLHESYLGQATRDCNKQGEPPSSDAVRARLQELLWQDLLRLLPDTRSAATAVDAGGDSRDEIEGRDVVELLCCVHSDTPLLSVAALPDDKRSSNFNM